MKHFYRRFIMLCCYHAIQIYGDLYREFYYVVVRRLPGNIVIFVIYIYIYIYVYMNTVLVITCWTVNWVVICRTFTCVIIRNTIKWYIVRQFAKWRTYVKVEIGKPISSSDAMELHDKSKAFINDSLNRMHENWHEVFR